MLVRFTGASFSRSFNMAELTSTFALADTMGLPELSPRYLCNIKEMLDGTLVQAAGDAMQWSAKESCTRHWYGVCGRGFKISG